MRKYLFLLLITAAVAVGIPTQAQCMERIESYVNFINIQQLSAKEYVLNKLHEYDMVIICERHHFDASQYDLFFQLAQDSWFQENVGHIFTEIGTVNSYPHLHNLLFNMPNLTTEELDKEILKIVRNYSSDPIWLAWNYPNFIKRLYLLNEKLTIDRKIDLIPSDEWFDWNSIQSVKDLNELNYGKYVNNVWHPVKDRDSVMYENIVIRFDSILQCSTRKKGLTILNFRHAFECNTHYGVSNDDIHYNTGKLLKDKYGNKIASVYLNGLGYPVTLAEEEGYTLIQDGRWDAAFKIAGKHDVGFDFAGSPFSKDSVDLTPFSFSTDSLLFSDLFTGFVFYLPLKEHIQIYGMNGFVDDEFRIELERRLKIYFESEKIEGAPVEFLENMGIVLYNPISVSYDNLEEMEFVIDKIVEIYKKTNKFNN